MRCDFELENWCEEVARQVLAGGGVRHAPVPVELLFQIWLPGSVVTEGLTFGGAVWVRGAGGRGQVLINPRLSAPERRLALAHALYVGLVEERLIPSAGLEAADVFARRLVLPESCLPAGWAGWPAGVLAAWCEAPFEAAQARLQAAGVSADRSGY